VIAWGGSGTILFQQTPHLVTKAYCRGANVKAGDITGTWMQPGPVAAHCQLRELQLAGYAR
jgi:hypothetical protein